MRTLYVTDLDGTLLLPDGSLGRRTRAVVNAFITSGGLITYATGRSFHSANRVMTDLNLHLPVITYAGAMLVDPVSGVADAAAMIPAPVIKTLLGALAENGLQPVLFLIKEGRDRVCWIEGDLSAGIVFFLGKRFGDPRHMPLRNWEEIDSKSVFYISVIAGADELAELNESLKEEVRDACHIVFVEDIYTPGFHWLEFTSAVGTKAHAAEKIRTLAGADSLVCFGDSFNDLPLFAIADQSYAVANSVAEVKLRATAVIGSNTDEGVATWLEAQFL
jgi:hydroxymethylpyrimidine pyrophosphatase-like HAD family hydrolase